MRFFHVSDMLEAILCHRVGAPQLHTYAYRLPKCRYTIENRVIPCYRRLIANLYLEGPSLKGPPKREPAFMYIYIYVYAFISPPTT